MWSNVLRRHWVLTAIAGACLIVNIGLATEIASAVTLGKTYAQIEHILSMGFLVLGPSDLVLSVLQGAYVFMSRRSVDPAEANWMRIFLVLSIVNSTIPIVFGAFAFGVLSFGYFWLR